MLLDTKNKRASNRIAWLSRSLSLFRLSTSTLATGVILLTASFFDQNVAIGSPFTPLEWQQKVQKHPNDLVRGQRKFLSWNRDKDRDFIDDEIKVRFKPSDRVNVIVDLNSQLPSSTISKLFSPFGHVTYIGRLITFVLLEDVPVKSLKKLAASPHVAMIEWQTPFYHANRISSRAIQARSSVFYGKENSAEAKGMMGDGITIAILDSGVDHTHTAFEGKSILAVDATQEPPLETNNPNSNLDITGHGTSVADIAMGKGIKANELPSRDCPPPPPPDDVANVTPPDCAGVAPKAKLVDIKVCEVGSCPEGYVLRGLEWLGINARRHDIRVANMSIANRCIPDDGDSTLPKLVNHLVALGIAVSISHGNAHPSGSPPTCGVNERITPSPGSASFAMTVAAVQDPFNGMGGIDQTIDRLDDWPYNGRLSGPRMDFDPITNPNLQALKPDFSAPGMVIFSAKSGTINGYDGQSGTSMAAPHVAGAAALILEKNKAIDPGSLKDLLRRTADHSINGAGPYLEFEPWQENLGSGIINVNEALDQMDLSQVDVGFENCVGPPTTPGGLCEVRAPQPPWNNTFDILTVDPNSGAITHPQMGQEVRLIAKVHNHGTAPATVLVNFGVYEFAAGNNQFFHIGTQRVSVPPGTTVDAGQLWTPTHENHQCIQVSIQNGLDSNFDNNVTQRNLQVGSGVFEFRIENPFMAPTKMEFEAKSDRDNWKCKLFGGPLALDSFTETEMRKVKVNFAPPPGTQPGESGNCNIAVFGTPLKEAPKRRLIGGVTVRTLIRKPCRMVGQVVDEKSIPISQARLNFSQASPPYESGEPETAELQAITTATDEDGIFSVHLVPSVNYRILVEKPGTGKGELEQRLHCGINRSIYVLGNEKLMVF